ncbi:cysteine hydrolase family protein [Methanimicrococcus blatticola]|uniref:Nicotinamidase-related amidase n=1 Tax=Methanimicrococcus blatticola TaxID=91560 RepID=A0A484F5G7_9EURY|nr:isochorismatase family cysteine hydrolase [Methanimicrococcus blatticola]MBZ3935903.1 cysteine hydrolase [Methanimicrococcus blatticola]MCC2509484.1 cysteine hydrolase [Methanimicrococcus blatticola]TDQ68361.1 nicotinamidase-related amidase [Methanimicrococcus blatticola]
MKKMLVVIDYQKDFVDGSIGFPGAELLDEGIANKVKSAAESSDSVIVYTMDTHTPDYLNTREGKALPVPHTIIETPGWDLYGKTGDAIQKAKSKAETNTKKNVPVYELCKTTFGVSPDKMLDLLQKVGADIETIEMVGLVTNMCVLSNVCVFQAAWPNAQIIVDGSLCASFDPVLHQKTLDILEGMQVKVV